MNGTEHVNIVFARSRAKNYAVCKLEHACIHGSPFRTTEDLYIMWQLQGPTKIS